MNYKSIHFAASVNHVAQERSDGCCVKQTRRCETATANKQTNKQTNKQLQSVACLLHLLNPIWRRSQYHPLRKTTALFWVITERLVVISYGRFGTTGRSHVKGSRIQKDFLIIGPWRWDREDVPKRRQEIAATRCVMTQKSEFLSTSRRRPEITSLYIFVADSAQPVSNFL
jgi:hypothetical protein